jgi:hypothetical protein
VDRRRITTGVSLLAIAAALVLVSPPGGGALTAVASHPRIGAKLPGGASSTAGWASSNWSGYAVTGGPYTSITGSWNVAPVSRSQRATYSSTWIGIDGFNNSNLIQTGTEADYYNGATHYDAWWEILPAAETVIPSISVQPGDQMSANIHQLPGGQWSITLSDSRGNQSFTITQSYKGQLTSAEWIEEAPSIGRIATLAQYGSPLTIDPGTVNGGNPGLVAADGGVMVQRAGQVSTPSNPDSDTDGFAMRYGSTAPAPPGS